MESPELFMKWMRVLYRGDEEMAEEAIDNYGEAVEEEREMWLDDPQMDIKDFRPYGGEVIMTDFLLVDSMPDTQTLFGTDWKASDDFAAKADEVAERFDFTIDWTEEELNSGDVMWLAGKLSYALSKHNILLYSFNTQGDLFIFAVVPNEDQKDFEMISTEWGLEYEIVPSTDCAI